MDSATLAQAMGNTIPAAQYAAYVADFNAALIQANCTTANRVAMFCAQVGHESAGLKYLQEIASGAAYEGRKDLGNTRPGDGPRFKGRGPIQLTGRHNYGEFSLWCKAKCAVPSSTFFVDNPNLVATPRWGFLAAAWYWTVARPQLNTYADAGDVVAATRAVNGGTNGLADRTSRWTRCRAMGSRLLPGGTTPTTPVKSLEDPVQLRAGNRSASISCKGARELVISIAYDVLEIHQLTFWGPYGRAGEPNQVGPGNLLPTNGKILDHYPWVVRVPDGALSCSLWWTLANDQHEGSCQLVF